MTPTPGSREEWAAWLFDLCSTSHATLGASEIVSALAAAHAKGREEALEQAGRVAMQHEPYTTCDDYHDCGESIYFEIVKLRSLLPASQADEGCEHEWEDRTGGKFTGTCCRKCFLVKP